MRGIPFLAIAAACVVAIASPANGAEAHQIALSEVASPAPSTGIDRTTLKNAAEGEIKRIDGSSTHGRRILVSVALRKADEAPIAFVVSAVLRDAKRGNVIAVVEGRARADATSPADSLRRQVADAAVRSAVRRIPDALAQ